MLDSALAGLPHGNEFRFIDALTELEPGNSAAGTYAVRGDESFLRAHFPGRPMLPGVILVEAIAQLGGVIAQCDPNHARLDDLRLAAIRQAKITGTAIPGETITVQATVEGRMGGLIQVTGTVTARSEQIASAKITLGGRAS